MVGLGVSSNINFYGHVGCIRPRGRRVLPDAIAEPCTLETCRTAEVLGFRAPGYTRLSQYERIRATGLELSRVESCGSCRGYLTLRFSIPSRPEPLVDCAEGVAKRGSNLDPLARVVKALGTRNTCCPHGICHTVPVACPGQVCVVVSAIPYCFFPVGAST